MQFEGLVPVIQCRNIEKTLAFYQQALRYIIIRQTVTEEGLQWAYLKSDNTFLMLQKITKLDTNQPLSGNIDLHYYTSDIVTQHQFMAARGIVVSTIETTPFKMKVFSVTDPEGNRITIGQNTRQ